MAGKVKTLRISEDLINKVEKQCDKENRNFTNMINWILIQYFKNLES